MLLNQVDNAKRRERETGKQTFIGRGKERRLWNEAPFYRATKAHRAGCRRVVASM